MKTKIMKWLLPLSLLPLTAASANTPDLVTPGPNQVEATVAFGQCQTWPVNACTVVYAPDFTLTIEARDK